MLTILKEVTIGISEKIHSDCYNKDEITLTVTINHIEIDANPAKLVVAPSHHKIFNPQSVVQKSNLDVNPEMLI